jgi:hypothetical protein
VRRNFQGEKRKITKILKFYYKFSQPQIAKLSTTFSTLISLFNFFHLHLHHLRPKKVHQSQYKLSLLITLRKIEINVHLRTSTSFFARYYTY